MYKFLEHYTTGQVAQLLGLNIATVIRWAETGRLKCIKTESQWRLFEKKYIQGLVKNYEKSEITTQKR